MQARAFNEIFIDYKKGFLTKTSTKIFKIRDEINYYLKLPPKISRFFPKLLNYSKDYSSYKMEYIPLQTISELMVNNKLDAKDSAIIANIFFKIFKEIHSISCLENSISKKTILEFYLQKTLTRIESLKKIDNLKGLVTQPFIIINGDQYLSFELLKERFVESIKYYASKYSSVSIIHGDLCFSNILYCPVRKKIKLIDPRGSFGHIGIYGDSYYDYAKIMHSINGGYDHIVHNQFYLNQIDFNNYIFTKTLSPFLSTLHVAYKELLDAHNINLNFIYLIEASLFLSMAALHYENLTRQKALYLTGIILLNKFYKEKNENLH